MRENEPPCDKTNKMTLRPAKTRISLDGCPGWSESLLGAHAILLVTRRLINVQLLSGCIIKAISLNRTCNRDYFTSFAHFMKSAIVPCNLVLLLKSWTSPTAQTAASTRPHYFHGNWSWNNFYGHSLSAVDSNRAVVSCWRKNALGTGYALVV